MSRVKRNARHTDDKKKTEGPLDNMQTRYKLYLDRILNSWGDRSWEFAIGLYMIKLHGSSFTLTAVQGIFASLTVILFSPLIGRWIERESRLREIKVCLIVQNAATAISCIFLSLFFVREKFSNETLIKTIETSAPIVLIVFSAISQLYSYGYSLCLEKDWIIALARDEKELSDWNAMLRRIDLCCKTIAPSLIGFLMEYSTLVSVLFIMSWNVISGFLEYFVLKSVFNEKHQALLAPKPKVSSSLKIIDIDAFKQYYKHFLLPGLSFGLLYLTVLGFDSITIGYISSQGIPEGAIGMISVVGAVFGILGTILFQLLSKRLSIKRVGFVGYLLEVTLLSLCLLEVFKPFDLGVKIFGGDLNVFLFLSGLVGSRVGLWTADLSVNQLIQTRTPCPSLVGGVQNSVSISAELVKFGIVTVMPNFDQFPILIVLSFGAISLATILFGFYSFRKDTDSSEPLVDESSCYGTFEKSSSQ